MMMPSRLQGTHEVISTAGCIPASTGFDVIGFLIRDPQLVGIIATAWNGTDNPKLLDSNYTRPTKIVYPIGWFPVNSSIAQDLIESWLANMTDAMGMEIVKQNTSKIFHENIDYNSTMGNWTADCSSLSQYDEWHHFGEKFVGEYKAKFDGRYPSLDPSISILTPQRRPYIYRRTLSVSFICRIKLYCRFMSQYTDILTYHGSLGRGPNIQHHQSKEKPRNSPPVQCSLERCRYLPSWIESKYRQGNEKLVITLNFIAYKGYDQVLEAFIHEMRRSRILQGGEDRKCRILEWSLGLDYRYNCMPQLIMAGLDGRLPVPFCVSWIPFLLASYQKQP